MTEAEWVDSGDSSALLELLRGRASERKLRLFLVACCRRVTALIPDQQRRAVVEIARRFPPEIDEIEDVWHVFGRALGAVERFADGLATKEEYEEAEEEALRYHRHYEMIGYRGPSPGQDPSYDAVAVSIGEEVSIAA